MRKADIVSAGVVAVFGLIVLLVVIPIWVPGHMEGGSYGLRAQDFPLVTAVSFTLFAGAFMVFRAFFSKADETDEPPITARSWRFLAIAGGVLAAITVLLDTVRFLAGGPVAVGAFMVMMGERRPLPVIALSLAAPLAVWLFFWKFLEFPLP
jgi:hypothetical protein